MIQDVVYGILKQIVIDWPTSPCYRLNTFFVLTDDSDWNADNVMKSYEDYLNGHYWTRLGVKRDSNVFQFGALAVEVTSSQVQKRDEAFHCPKFHISIGRQIKCLDCPSECAGKTTRSMLDIQNMNDLAIIIKEFFSYVYIEATLGEQEFIGYVSAHRLVCMKDAEWIVTKECEALMIERQNPTIDVSDFGVKDIATATTEIVVCACADPVAFVCNATLPEGGGVTKCETCP